MRFLSRTICFALAVLILAGCSHKPAPPPLAEDLRAAQKAMSINEVSLMLRSGYKEQTIIAEVTRRHVVAKPDAQTENALTRLGANAALIGTLKTDANILTAAQKAAYDYLAAKRTSGAEQQNEPVVQSDDRQKEAGAVEKTVQNLRKVDAYKAKKEALETRITAQESQIFMMRRNGYSDAQLLPYNEQLAGYREQLRDLEGRNF